MNALRAELLRATADLVLLGFLGAAVLLGLTGSPDVVLVAALYPAVRYTYELRWGTVARAVLLASRQSVLFARTVVVPAAGLVIGAAGVLAAALVPWGYPDHSSVLLTAPLAAVFGLCAGVALRNYFLAPFFVVCLYIGSKLAVVTWPVLDSSMGLLGVGGLLLFGVFAWLSASLRDV